jgi:hypothetical protein
MFINLFLIFSFTDVVRLQITITITFSNMQCKHKANADINIAIFISKINMESCLLGMDMDIGVSVCKVSLIKTGLMFHKYHLLNQLQVFMRYKKLPK